MGAGVAGCGRAAGARAGLAGSARPVRGVGAAGVARGRGSAARADRRVQKRLLMTVRVTSLRGADAGAYYVDPERRGLATYYLEAGEPAGRWAGEQAHAWGWRGKVETYAFLELMDGAGPSGEQLGRAYGERSVRGYDITFSAPKSASTLWALGDAHIAGESLAAHDAAVKAVLDFVERHATTRATIDGLVQHVDADGLAIAVFRQHTSRLLDPQLHTHAVVAAKVRIPDGRWLALDARLIKHDQLTLSALYHATLRSELTQRLGVDWHLPVNGIAEIAGLPEDVLAEFSQRARQVDQRLERKLDRSHETFDREPTPREAWRLEREAVLDSRPSKRLPEDHGDLRGEWFERIEALGHDPVGVIGGVLGESPGLGGSRARPRSRWPTRRSPPLPSRHRHGDPTSCFESWRARSQ